MEVHRGEVFYADLSPVVGSEQGGGRPVLIVQNEIGNRHSPTVIAAAITSRLDKARLPTHINIRAADTGLAKDSVVLLEQIRTLDKHRLRERAGQITPEDQKRVDQALDVSLGLTSYSGAVAKQLSEKIMHKTRNLFSAKTAQKGSGFLILRCFFVQAAIVFSFSSLIFLKRRAKAGYSRQKMLYFSAEWLCCRVQHMQVL